jgi:hypothetical protein
VRYTNDTAQDRPIVPGENRIIYAYGTSGQFQYHGANRGSAVVVFYTNSTSSNSTTDSSLIEFSSPTTIPSIATATICQTYQTVWL